MGRGHKIRIVVVVNVRDRVHIGCYRHTGFLSAGQERTVEINIAQNRRRRVSQGFFKKRDRVDAILDVL
jgi:hypothetical protein